MGYEDGTISVAVRVPGNNDHLQECKFLTTFYSQYEECDIIRFQLACTITLPYPIMGLSFGNFLDRDVSFGKDSSDHLAVQTTDSFHLFQFGTYAIINYILLLRRFLLTFS
jgi:hypothetical protein